MNGQPRPAAPGSPDPSANRDAAGTRSRIRVLHLGSPSGLYGAERWILALAEHLPASRFETTVGVIIDDPRIAEAELYRECRARGIGAVQFIAYGRLNVAAISRIRRYLRQERIDILHTHGYKTDLIGIAATLGTGCRNVTTPHGWSKDAGVALQCYEWLDRVAFMFMDAVVPLSMDLYRELSRWPGGRRRLHLIRNGVDLHELDAAADSAESAGEPATREGPIVFGYVGQLIHRKGLDTLITAFHSLGLPNAELWIVGEGPQRVELESLSRELGTSDSVRFLGFRQDRIALLRQFDAFVLPSSLEGIPRCLMEAMGAGIPVIASDIPGCNDLVESGSTGLLFSCGDERGLREAMKKIHQDPGLAKSLGRSGRSFVRQHYSAQAMADAYADLYSSLSDGAALRRAGARVR